jgi:hypothetical protein
LGAEIPASPILVNQGGYGTSAEQEREEEERRRIYAKVTIFYPFWRFFFIRDAPDIRPAG